MSVLRAGPGFGRYDNEFASPTLAVQTTAEQMRLTMQYAKRQTLRSAMTLRAVKSMAKLRNSWLSDSLLVTGLILIGFLARVTLADVPNFSPVAALALFAGFWLSRPYLAWIVPFAVMFSTDAYLDRGGYELPVQMMVYGTLALPCLLGQLVRRTNQRDQAKLSVKQPSRFRRGMVLAVQLGSSTLAGAVLFFVGTNLACFWYWYDHSAAGLSSCFVNAIPFFRFTLLGDLTFLALFGSAHLVASLLMANYAAEKNRLESSIT